MIRFKKSDGSDYPDWKTDIIGNHFNLSSGSTPSTTKSEFFENGQLCWINSGELEGKYIQDTSNKITNLAKNTFNLKIYEPNHLIIAIYGLEAAGVRGKGSINKMPTTISQACMAFQATGDVSIEFMYYLYKIHAQTLGLKYAQGTKQQNLSSDILNNYKICFPCLEEQEKITSFLSQFDSTIELLEKELVAREKMRKAIIQKIFAQNYSSTSKWQEYTLSKILKERKTKAPKDGTYEHVSLTKEGVVPKSERYERDFLVTTDDKAYKITKVNDICYNPANLKFGVICRNKYKEGIFSPIYITFEVNEKYSIPEFMELLVTQNDFINYALKYQQGTVYERMAVSPEDLLQIKVLLPDIEEQKRIVSIINDLDNVTEITKNELEALNNLRKSYIQEIFIR